METANVIYHLSVILIAIVIFFMKITAPNDFLELILKLLGKVVPIFCIAFAVVQLFKHCGII